PRGHSTVFAKERITQATMRLRLRGRHAQPAHCRGRGRMPAVRCPHLYRRIVPWTEQGARSVDGDHGLTAEDIEAFFERMDVRANRSARRQLVYAEAGVHRPA